MVAILQQAEDSNELHLEDKQNVIEIEISERPDVDNAKVKVNDETIIRDLSQNRLDTALSESVSSQRGSVLSNGSNEDITSVQWSEIEEEDEETDLEEGEWIIDPIPSTAIQSKHQVTVANGELVLPNSEPSNFGDVCIKNSTNVHLGNRTFYKGPVTVKQFVYTIPVSQEQDTFKGDLSQISTSNASDSSKDHSADRPTVVGHPDYKKVSQWLWSWRCAAFVCVLALILAAAIIFATVLLAQKAGRPPFPQIPDGSLEGVQLGKLRFVERWEWGAQPPSEPLEKIKLPVPYVMISHTATDFCSTQQECTVHVRFAQTFHIEGRNWTDIGYNFLVGGDGLAYVGRGWDYIGAHTYGYNNISLGIAFIGTFNTIVPPQRQLYAAQKIIELGVEAGKIKPDYKLLGHRQVISTLSPGTALYNIIQTWPHWASKP